MRYLSVCSGIEAATVAWKPLGWQAVGFSEIEKFPRAVLAHHYPGVPNFGDMTKFQEWPDDLAPDVLVGGTPCQSFSVAGLRKGLADPRGNLALTYLALADRYRPEWLVWENVPGVLSSNGGRDFGAFLGGLVELGYGFAYRVLNAIAFGVPQRRRRVFVVANRRDFRRAGTVLFERELQIRDFAPNPSLPTVDANFDRKWGSHQWIKGGCCLVEHDGRIRRFTPTEIERAMGFPDGYTAIPWRNKPASECPDGPRYKALGNSMAVPVMAWIGRRIEAVVA